MVIAARAGAGSAVGSFWQETTEAAQKNKAAVSKNRLLNSKVFFI